MKISGQLRSVKLRVFVPAILVFLVMGVFAWRVFREPVYLGKRLGVWVQDLRERQPWHSKFVEWIKPRLPKQWQTRLPKRFDPDEASQRALWVLIHFGPRAKPAIPALIRLLEDPDPIVRGHAVYVLQRIEFGNERAIAAVSRVVRDPNEVLRYHAVLALQNLGATNQECVAALTPLLSDDSPTVRGEALRALGKIGFAPITAISKIRTNLQHSNAHVRLFAAEALWRISGDTNQPTTVALSLLSGGAPTTPIATPGLQRPIPTRLSGAAFKTAFYRHRSYEMILQSIGSRWDSVESSAAELLLKMHPVLRESEPPLSSNAGYREDMRRLVTARVLWRINREPQPLLPYFKLFDSDDEAVRMYAAESLVALGAPVVPELISRLERRSDVKRRTVAIALLGHLGAAAEPAIPLLIAALRQTNDVTDLSAAAAEALGNIGIGNDEVISVLREAIEDQTAQLQISAARAMASIGLQNGPLVSNLRESLENRRLPVQLAAAEALSKLNSDFKNVEPVIVRALQSKLPEIRIKALQLIATIGPAASPVAPHLTPLLQNKDEGIRNAANEALKRIDRSRGL